MEQRQRTLEDMVSTTNREESVPCCEPASLFGGIYRNRRVLVTGHTGFKGSWLACWLSRMGARVCGYSLPPPTTPAHVELIDTGAESVTGDIRDRKLLGTTLARVEPEIVFHLAAQPLVRDSYADPVTTYESNVIGTLNVCEACRATPSVRALVAVTTDKVYRNREWYWGYRENDPLGGHDPYSSSKACAELLLESYRLSYLHPDHRLLLASVRAGNVIGGGDWARDRLLPDIMRATADGGEVVIRNPRATRPWQHVLECLSGYLTVGWRLLERNGAYATSFNFGPPQAGVLRVEEVLAQVSACWPRARFNVVESAANPHEAGLLTLDCAKAMAMLDWRPVWSMDTTFERTVAWYRRFYESQEVMTEQDLAAYVTDAHRGGLVWTR